MHPFNTTITSVHHHQSIHLSSGISQCINAGFNKTGHVKDKIIKNEGSYPAKWTQSQVKGESLDLGFGKSVMP